MEKIQVSLPSPVLKEMAAMMKEAGFEKESEFGRHIITEWITLRKYGVIKAPGGLMSTTMMSGLASGNDNMTSLV